MASSSTRGSGWTPRGPASLCRSAELPRAASPALGRHSSRAGARARLHFDHAGEPRLLVQTHRLHRVQAPSLELVRDRGTLGLRARVAAIPAALPVAAVPTALPRVRLLAVGLLLAVRIVGRLLAVRLLLAVGRLLLAEGLLLLLLAVRLLLLAVRRLLPRLLALRWLLLLLVKGRRRHAATRRRHAASATRWRLP